MLCKLQIVNALLLFVVNMAKNEIHTYLYSFIFEYIDCLHQLHRKLL